MSGERKMIKTMRSILEGCGCEVESIIKTKRNCHWQCRVILPLGGKAIFVTASSSRDNNQMKNFKGDITRQINEEKYRKAEDVTENKNT